MLVIAAVVLTIVAFISPGPQFSIVDGKTLIPLTWVLAGRVLDSILSLCFLQTTSKLKRELADIMLKGEQLCARFTSSKEEDIDRYDPKTREWDEAVGRILKGTEFEKIWMSVTGITKPEDEDRINWTRKVSCSI